MLYTMYIDVELSITCTKSVPWPFEVVNSVKPSAVFESSAEAFGVCRPETKIIMADIKNAVAQRILLPDFRSFNVLFFINYLPIALAESALNDRLPRIIILLSLWLQVLATSSP